MVAEMYIQMLYIFYVNGMLTGIFDLLIFFFLLINYRSWQRKLNCLVKDMQQRAHIYACLWILVNEECADKFYEKQETFIAYWREKQPKFIQYYEMEYKPRAGM